MCMCAEWGRWCSTCISMCVCVCMCVCVFKWCSTIAVSDGRQRCRRHCLLLHFSLTSVTLFLPTLYLFIPPCPHLLLSSSLSFFIAPSPFSPSLFHTHTHKYAHTHSQKHTHIHAYALPLHHMSRILCALLL